MKLILIRHGQSVCNKENKFTGWSDVPLSSLEIETGKPYIYELDSDLKIIKKYSL